MVGAFPFDGPIPARGRFVQAADRIIHLCGGDVLPVSREYLVQTFALGFEFRDAPQQIA